MPVNVQDANFQDLLAAYYLGMPAQEAAEHLLKAIRGKANLQLTNLLRDYRVRPVYSDREIKLRAAVDRLLIFYDVMEIAALTGFIRPPDRADFWKETESILEKTQVRKYYVEYYPLNLPRLLLLRMKGRHITVEKDTDLLVSLFVKFLELDRRFMADLNDGVFLRMLDSFTIDGRGFDDMVALIESQQEFIRRILLPPDEREIVDKALHEFSLFMQFSFDLYDLLARMRACPLLQSEVWNHYSYWFGIIGEQLERGLGQALNKFLTWRPGKNNEEQAKEIQDYVTKAKTVIKELTSLNFGKPVKELLMKIS
jgi:hypothetical protein